MFVEEDKRFPYLVGRLLEDETGLRIATFNSGVGGNHTLHSINTLLNKVMPLQPDFVVLMHNINDLIILLYENSYWNNHPTRSVIQTIHGKDISPTRLAKDALILAVPNLYLRVWKIKEQFLLPPSEHDEWVHITGQRRIINQEQFLKEFSANLRLFISMCRHRGIIPILMTQANRLTSPPTPLISQWFLRRVEKSGITYFEFKTIYDAFNDTTREIANQLSVPLIDLAKKIPQTKQYMFDPFHLNDDGSQLAASIITKAFLSTQLTQK